MPVGSVRSFLLSSLEVQSRLYVLIEGDTVLFIGHQAKQIERVLGST